MIKNQISVSKNFRANANKAITSIVLFIIVYIIMFALALAITAICVYAGIKLIILFPRLMTIVLGIGLASLGFLVLFFLIKFVFSKHKIDRSHLTEIKRAKQPQLFALIDDIVKQVGTSPPKRVYMSADVNASVFYDSSFWSMFLPIQKNLQIGMGLVNSVTTDELKAILSHEFGHFSQRSMKVGSYVYNVNQVIHNMLYDNDGYDRVIQSWANISEYIAIFVIAAIKIITGIQWVLQKMYGYINKRYMALSREMEFHADEIAANITGYQPLSSSLLRMSLSDHSYNSVLEFYDGQIKENRKSENIYPEHTFLLKFLAAKNDILIKDDLPVLREDSFSRFNKSKLVIEDQWASHPSTPERIERLVKTGLSSKSIDNTPATKIFNDLEGLQKWLTNKIFKDVVYKEKPHTLSTLEFKNIYQEKLKLVELPEIYNAYYDSRSPSKFDLSTSGEFKDKSLEELFSDGAVDLVYELSALESDIDSLSEIKNNRKDIKTYDYDGKKYRHSETSALLEKLDKVLKQCTDKVKINDQRIYKYFKEQEEIKGGAKILDRYYLSLFAFDEHYQENIGLYELIINNLQFLHVTTPQDQIMANFRHLHPLEVQLKEKINDLLQDPDYSEIMEDVVKNDFEVYVSKHWQYFRNNNYVQNNLEILQKAILNFILLISENHRRLKKRLLDYQVSLVQK